MWRNARCFMHAAAAPHDLTRNFIRIMGTAGKFKSRRQLSVDAADDKYREKCPSETCIRSSREESQREREREREVPK